MLRREFDTNRYLFTLCVGILRESLQQSALSCVRIPSYHDFEKQIVLDVARLYRLGFKDLLFRLSRITFCKESFGRPLEMHAFLLCSLIRLTVLIRGAK